MNNLAEIFMAGEEHQKRLHDLAGLVKRNAARLMPANDNRDGYPGITSSADLVDGFVPPDYHIDGIAQSGFLYSVTAMTGTGKTAVLLFIAALTALGEPLGDLYVKQGRVLYFAGENPDDVTMRWIAMSHHMGFDAGDIDVHFIKGTFSIPEMHERIRQDVDRLGGVSMIVVDTSAAYFQGDDENSNTELGKHARELRSLTTLDGHPIVFVAAHPIKNPDPHNLLPRGGGAFIGEVDGNLVLRKGEGGGVGLTWHGKHRGVDFTPVVFQLKSVTAPTLKDSRGRDVPTVMASILSRRESRERAWAAQDDENDVLLLIERNGKLSLTGMAEELVWITTKGEPHKERVRRAADKLRADKLVTHSGRRWRLTEAGKEWAMEAHESRLEAESAAEMAENIIARAQEREGNNMRVEF